eukprot:28301-Alexandrium_andersonii.AAC.1
MATGCMSRSSSRRFRMLLRNSGELMRANPPVISGGPHVPKSTEPRRESAVGRLRGAMGGAELRYAVSRLKPCSSLLSSF